MLFSTVFVYLSITIAVLILVGFGRPMDMFKEYYYAFSTVAATAIGFYTGTNSKKDK